MLPRSSSTPKGQALGYLVSAPAPKCRRGLRRVRRPEVLPVERVTRPAAVVRGPSGTFVVAGLARVDCWPHRSPWSARRLADRISARPLTYLPLCTGLGMPGVTDLRPWFGKELAHA
ncbi:MAG: hypothetical protein JWO31_4276 [Phycisphaerales bacterium]|nr:hypothetical protein [Phycisphaerales bacterium]